MRNPASLERLSNKMREASRQAIKTIETVRELLLQRRRQHSCENVISNFESEFLVVFVLEGDRIIGTERCKCIP